MRLVPRPMTAVFPSGVKEVFRVRMASGRTVEATANHPFLTVDGWCPLGELAVGDRLGVPRRVPAPTRPEPLAQERILLLAQLIGSGSDGARQPLRCADDTGLAAADLRRSAGAAPPAAPRCGCRPRST